MRAQQQFGEIDQAGALAADLVFLVHAQLRAAVQISVGHLQMLRPTTFVLLRVDPPHQLARRETAFVEFEIGADALDQPQLVVGIEHLEALRQFRFLPVQAQQAVRDAVEGADPQAARAVAEQAFDAAAHFGGGLVGEGDGQDAVRRHADDFVEPADAVREHARLAGTGAGEHEVMTGRRGDGLALGFVQPVEQVGNIHRGILGDAAGRARPVDGVAPHPSLSPQAGRGLHAGFTGKNGQALQCAADFPPPAPCISRSV